MSSYAIMRTAKLKAAGGISASIQHTFRERKTPNADEHRTYLNQHTGAQSGTELREKIAAAIPARRRKDAVLCIEHFFGTSPEWAAKATRKQTQEFFDRSLEWLKQTYGPANVMYFGTQLDEKTPHAVAYVVPLKDGALNAKAWLGGTAKLRELQTSYAASVKSLGLERGIEGSSASHERVQRFYGALNEAEREHEPLKRDAQAAVKQLTLADKVSIARGAVPPTIAKAIEQTTAASARARLAADVDRKRIAGEARLKALKELPAREEAVKDREIDLKIRASQLTREREELEEKTATIDTHIHQAVTKQLSAWGSRGRDLDRKAAKIDEDEKKIAQDRAALENERVQIEQSAREKVYAVLKDAGIVFANHGTRGVNYIGELVTAGRQWVTQMTRQFGLVIHPKSGELQDAFAVTKAIREQTPMTVSYDRATGKVSARRSTPQELEQSRDRGLSR